MVLGQALAALSHEFGAFLALQGVVFGLGLGLVSQATSTERFLAQTTLSDHGPMPAAHSSLVQQKTFSRTRLCSSWFGYGCFNSVKYNASCHSKHRH